MTNQVADGHFLCQVTVKCLILGSWVLPAVASQFAVAFMQQDLFHLKLTLCTNLVAALAFDLCVSFIS